MKKIVSIFLICLCIAGIGILGFFIFRTKNVDTIEVVGDMQTIYFVNETTDFNFNKAKLKVTYKDNSSKLIDLDKSGVKVKNFSTSIANQGLAKFEYKSKTIEVPYQVIYNGMYYLKTTINSSVDKDTGEVSTTTKNYKAGLDIETGQDATTALEMIYFYNDGACDYYSRSSDTASWIVDDGHCDNSFNYSIVGDTIQVNLGESKKYDIKANFSSDGSLSLTNTNIEYFDSENKDFMKSKVENKFSYIEMKSDRQIEKVSVQTYTSENPLVFEVNQKYDECGQDIKIEVVCKNDNFLKTVYVRFNTSMLINKQGFTTNQVLESMHADAFYKSKPFTIYYKVVA